MSENSILEGKKILIVDDELDIVDALEELLPMCDVAKASTFDEAKELLESRYFDLAILDIMGVDGYKLLNMAKRRNITAVMLTAHAFSPDNLARSIKEGAASYLPKEEMARITAFLIDILKAQEEGKSTWEPWQERLPPSLATTSQVMSPGKNGFCSMLKSRSRALCPLDSMKSFTIWNSEPLVSRFAIISMVFFIFQFPQIFVHFFPELRALMLSLKRFQNSLSVSCQAAPHLFSK